MNKQERVKQIIKEEIQKFVSEMSVMSGGAVEGVSGTIEEETPEEQEKPLVAENASPRDILADLNQMQQMMDSWLYEVSDSMEESPEQDKAKHFMISKVIGKINAGIDNLKYLLGAKE